MQRGIIKASEFRHFLFADNATMTVESHTGKHFTFKVTAKKGSSDISWVKVLTGPDNCKDYSLIGTVVRGKFRPSRGSEATSIKGFSWLMTASEGKIDSQAKLYHEGRCGRCGRKLTVPESILSGFGASCRERL